MLLEGLQRFPDDERCVGALVKLIRCVRARAAPARAQHSGANRSAHWATRRRSCRLLVESGRATAKNAFVREQATLLLFGTLRRHKGARKAVLINIIRAVYALVPKGGGLPCAPHGLLQAPSRCRFDPRSPQTTGPLSSRRPSRATRRW